MKICPWGKTGWFHAGVSDRDRERYNTGTQDIPGRDGGHESRPDDSRLFLGTEDRSGTGVLTSVFNELPAMEASFFCLAERPGGFQIKRGAVQQKHQMLFVECGFGG